MDEEKGRNSSKIEYDQKFGNRISAPRRAKGAVPVQLQLDRDRVGRDGRALRTKIKSLDVF